MEANLETLRNEMGVRITGQREVVYGLGPSKVTVYDLEVCGKPMRGIVSWRRYDGVDGHGFVQEWFDETAGAVRSKFYRGENPKLAVLAEVMAEVA